MTTEYYWSRNGILLTFWNEFYTANPFPVMKTGFTCVHISTLLSLRGSCFHYRDIPACSLFYLVRDCNWIVFNFHNLGWSCRDVTSEDVRLIPLISGRGKQCRLMGTVGVARGLGDHDLIVKSSLVNCKEFLSCQPEVRVKCIDDLHPDSVLILASGRCSCGVWRRRPVLKFR